MADLPDESVIEQWLERVSGHLPVSINVFDLGVRPKAPWKVLSVREALIWRTEEIARASFSLLQNDKVAAAALLARGVVEDTALMSRLAQVVAERDEFSPDALDEILMKLLLGTRQTKEAPETYKYEAANILGLVDRLDRRVGGLRRVYDLLSEYAHPNWGGVSRLFSKIDYAKFTTRFGRVDDNLKGPREQVLSVLAGCLELFERDYNSIAEAMDVWLADLPKLGSTA